MNLPDRPVGNQLEQRLRLRMTAVHISFQQETARGFCRRVHSPDLIHGHGHRFFAEHVFAALQRAPRQLRMKRVRGTHIDHIHRRIVKKLLVGIKMVLDPVIERKRPRPFRIASGDPVGAAVFRMVQGKGKRAGNLTRSGNSPVQHDDNTLLFYPFFRKRTPSRRFFQPEKKDISRKKNTPSGAA